MEDFFQSRVVSAQRVAGRACWPQYIVRSRKVYFSVFALSLLPGICLFPQSLKREGCEGSRLLSSPVYQEAVAAFIWFLLFFDPVYVMVPFTQQQQQRRHQQPKDNRPQHQHQHLSFLGFSHMSNCGCSKTRRGCMAFVLEASEL